MSQGAGLPAAPPQSHLLIPLLSEMLLQPWPKPSPHFRSTAQHWLEPGNHRHLMWVLPAAHMEMLVSQREIPEDRLSPPVPRLEGWRSCPLQQLLTGISPCCQSPHQDGTGPFGGAIRGSFSQAQPGEINSKSTVEVTPSLYELICGN